MILIRTLFREYKVSKKEQGQWSKALDICKALNLGLVLWHTEEVFEDLRTITGSSNDVFGNDFFDTPAWTALNNANKESCTGAQNCNGKLVASNYSNNEFGFLVCHLYAFYSCGNKHLEEAHNCSPANLGTRMSKVRMTRSATNSRQAAMVM